MDELTKKGKHQTVLICVCILLIIISAFIKTQYNRPDMKALQGLVIPSALTIVLLIFAYLGKNWARIAFTIYVGIGIILSMIIILPIVSEKEMPVLIILGYIFTVFVASFYHFGFSKSYKAFQSYQKEKEEI